MTIVMSDLRVDGKRSDHRSIVRRSDETSSIYIYFTPPMPGSTRCREQRASAPGGRFFLLNQVGPGTEDY